ncbi:MAG: hypothetical protein FWH27_09035 [Planctomycetaceae bacterium]|nr:hypothetical protein [Planctomycetaceae bacterium]
MENGAMFSNGNSMLMICQGFESGMAMDFQRNSNPERKQRVNQPRRF